MNARWILKWLGDKGQRVGLLILLVGIIALYFSIRGYYAQQSVNLPNLVSIGPKIYSNNQTASIGLEWFNTGRKAAIGGRALLFAVNKDQTRRHKIGETLISGGLPGNAITARISVDMRQSLELFLVCVAYLDDNNKSYQQVYLYRLGRPTDGPNEIPLVEELRLDPPRPEACNEQ